MHLRTYRNIAYRIQVKDTSTEPVKDTSRVQVNKINDRHLRLIKLIGEEWISASALRSSMGFKSRIAFANNYISPLYKKGILLLQQPDAPNSPTQKYGLSVKGKAIFYTGNLSLINTNATSNDIRNDKSSVTSNHATKLTYAELCKLVINICTTWKSAHEISQRAKRSTNYMRMHILPRMIKDGYLEMFDKENSRSPVQKYRATDKGNGLIHNS